MDFHCRLTEELTFIAFLHPPFLACLITCEKPCFHPAGRLRGALVLLQPLPCPSSWSPRLRALHAPQQHFISVCSEPCTPCASTGLGSLKSTASRHRMRNKACSFGDRQIRGDQILWDQRQGPSRDMGVCGLGRTHQEGLHHAPTRAAAAGAFRRCPCTLMGCLPSAHCPSIPHKWSFWTDASPVTLPHGSDLSFFLA